MKKNLRIVSAAAAALLAVAPVAASTVSTVFADTAVTVEGGTVSTTPAKATLKLNVNNVATLANGDPASKVQASLATPTLPTGASVAVSTAKIYTATAAEGTGKGMVGSGAVVTNLTPSADYYAAATVTITGLEKSKSYSIDVNGTTYTVSSDATGTISGFGVVSNKFKLFDTTKTGAPFVRETAKNLAVDSGSVDLTAYNVTAVVTAINTKYAAATNGTAIASFKNVAQDVRDGLKAAGVDVKADGTFNNPATPVKVTLNLEADNGKTSTFVVTLNPSATQGDKTYPQMSYNGKVYAGTATIDALKADEKFNYVPVNGVVDTKAIQDAFYTTVNETPVGGTPTLLTPTVDISKVNTKVAGKYPVVVSATNADKKTTKVTFMLTVGEKGANYVTVQSNGAIPVYQINGNTVTDSKTTVQNGDQIATFGQPVIINGKSYTHINSASSDLYVETQYVDGTFKPADKVSKTVMHNAYIYDAKRKRVGTKTLAAYTKVDVYGKPTKLEDGSLVYKIGDNQYVMADNIDGTSRVLSHNAYVYKTSKKRADKRVLRSGSTVTTYGSPYTFKNGKAYYRIGGPAKQYIKVANVR